MEVMAAKKTTKKVTTKAPSDNTAAAFAWLCMALRSRGKYEHLADEAERRAQ